MIGFILAATLLTALPDAARELPERFCVEGRVAATEFEAFAVWGPVPIESKDHGPKTRSTIIKAAYVPLPLASGRYTAGVWLQMAGDPVVTGTAWRIVDHRKARALIGERVRACGRRPEIPPGIGYYTLIVESVEMLGR